MKLLIATLVAPFGAIVGTVFSLSILPNTHYGIEGSRSFTEFALQAAGYSFFTVPISFICVVLIGLPIYFMVGRRSSPTRHFYVVPAIIFASFITWDFEGGYSLFGQMLGISCAIVVSAMFAQLVDTKEEAE